MFGGLIIKFHRSLVREMPKVTKVPFHGSVGCMSIQAVALAHDSDPDSQLSQQAMGSAEKIPKYSVGRWVGLQER